METSNRLFNMTHKFLGLKEIAGATHNPAILVMFERLKRS